MHVCNPPEIQPSSDNEASTKITFSPDVHKFGLDKLNDAHMELIRRRCYDIAACVAPVKVTYNGEPIPVGSFADYVTLFGSNAACVRPNDQWEIAVGRSPTSSFEHMSFVNCMHTPRGGAHLTLVTNQLVKAIEDAVSKQGHKCTHTQVRFQCS